MAKILLLEADATIRDYVAIVLQRAGHRVFDTPHTHSARNVHFTQQPFNLVIIGFDPHNFVEFYGFTDYLRQRNSAQTVLFMSADEAHLRTVRGRGWMHTVLRAVSADQEAALLASVESALAT